MYSLINRALSFERKFDRSLKAPISALLRYEILVHHGGVYFDFKTEGLKKLDPFLKYENFFLDCDYLTYKSIKWVGNGGMGAVANNYQLHFVLTRFLSQDIFDFYNTGTPGMVGGFVIRESFTEEEVYKNIGFGFQLLFPAPAQGNRKIKGARCPYEKKTRPDQEIFEVADKEGKQYKVPIPCLIYPEAFIIMYFPLAKTWVGKGKFTN